MLEGLLPGETVDTVSNLIFSTFDKDNRGSLSFVEFVSSIHCMSNSSPEVISVTKQALRSSCELLRQGAVLSKVVIS